MVRCVFCDSWDDRIHYATCIMLRKNDVYSIDPAQFSELVESYSELLRLYREQSEELKKALKRLQYLEEKSHYVNN